MGSYDVIISRFFCSLMLHLQVIRDIYCSIRMVKFLTKHAPLLDNLVYAYLICMMKFCGTLFTETMNIIVICQQTSTLDCIINLLAIGIIAEIDKIFYASVGKISTKQVLHEENLPVFRKGGMKFERNIAQKCLWFLYKFLRLFYVSIYFYFMPFLSIAIS